MDLVFPFVCVFTPLCPHLFVLFVCASVPTPLFVCMCFRPHPFVWLYVLLSPPICLFVCTSVPTLLSICICFCSHQKGMRGGQSPKLRLSEAKPLVSEAKPLVSEASLPSAKARIKGP